MIAVFAPSVAVGAGVAAALWVVRGVRPDLVARILVVTTAAIMTGVVAASWILSLGFLAHLPVGESVLAWCREPLGAHAPLPAVVGVPSVVMAAVLTTRCVRVVVNWRRISENDRGGVEIVESPQPIAYAVPGRGGLIVVSCGLLELLGHAERRAVLAHEAAHVRHRHDRYLVVAALASAVGLGPILGERLRHACERWADEEAASHVGSRETVARALGRTALASTAPDLLRPAIAATGVTERIRALVTAPPAHRRFPALLPGLTLGILVLPATGVQLHHAAEVALAVCGT